MEYVKYIVPTVVIILVLLVTYYTYTKENFVRNNELDNIVENLKKVFPIVENLNFYEGDKSYTINKKNVYICMKDENSRYYNRNFLIFVILHEISHALCDEIGHTDKFSRIFQQVLQKAAVNGLYDPNGKKVVNYCNYK